jgi:hypothetical protein
MEENSMVFNEPTTFIVDHFSTNYYYGNTVEVALPTLYEGGITRFKILYDGEAYSPVPYAVAVYELVAKEKDLFGYELVGIKIKYD